MPDFYISAVKYNQNHTHIEEMRTHKVTINSQGKTSFDTAGSENTRKFIAELILTGKVSFKTLTKKSNIYSEGQDVRVAGNYLTTDPNNTTRDNLGNLPTF